MSVPQTSIVIVSWNTRDLLAHCIASIAASFISLRLNELQVLVVDNGSSDGSVALVQSQFPWVQVIESEENLGFARANNLAIKKANSPYILLLNSDTIVTEGVLESLIDFIKKNDDVGIAGPKLLNPDGTFQASYGRFPTLLVMIVRLMGLANRVFGPYFPSAGPERSHDGRDVDWVGGACLLVRRSAVEEIGLLDEQFFMYCEEMDWCYRMRQGGWRVCYLPAAEVIHFGGASSKSVSSWILARQWKALLHFWRKHHGFLSAAMIRIWIAVFGIGRVLAYLVAYILGFGERRRLFSAALANLNLTLLRTNEPYK